MCRSMTTRTCNALGACAALFLAVGTTSAPVYAQIVYGGSSTVQFYGASNGNVTPAVLNPFVQLTATGVKVSLVTINYTATAAGPDTISWLILRPITVGPSAVTISHVNQFDGTLSYSGGVTFTDMRMRTITAQTDTDLAYLHSGFLPSGSSFNAMLNTGFYTQNPGADNIRQYFFLDFINSAPGDTVTLTLPTSVLSSVPAEPLNSVPEPGAFAFAGVFLGGLAFRLRRRRG